MKYTPTEDQPLLDALAHLYPQASKTTFRSWVKEGRVAVDGITVKNANVIINKGQELGIGNRKKKVIADRIPVIYEDDDFIVIDKPNGLLSVATAFQREETAYAILKTYYRPRQIHIVHRLDQDTSGSMLFAFHEKACEQLKALFEAHDIERNYVGIVEGHLDPADGTWESYLYEDDNYVVRTTTDPAKGEKAITHYRTLTTSKRYALLNLKLETGKKNQIRVHCQVAGHPIAGDKKYGAETNPIKRLALHAHFLSFVHPKTKKRVRFEAPLPDQFCRMFQSLQPKKKP